MKRYKGDPYWTSARFISRCNKCHSTIEKENKIFYYPKCRSVFCEKCGDTESRSFEAAAFDEAQYNGGF